METMTAEKRSDRTALDRLVDALVNDILNASDQELLEEVRNDQGDPAAIAATTRALFEESAVTTAKSLLAAAKAAVAADRRRLGSVAKTDMTEASRCLQDLLASDPETRGKLTLAARKGKGLSEEDMRGMLEDLEELGVIRKADSDEGKR
jgi:uncharacterized membrane-anchored protein YjiN (DUF445 family)